MSLFLFSLAFNPNITPEQFKQLADAHVALHKRTLESVAESIRGAPPELQTKMLAAVLPSLFLL